MKLLIPLFAASLLVSTACNGNGKEVNVDGSWTYITNLSAADLFCELVAAGSLLPITLELRRSDDQLEGSFPAAEIACTTTQGEGVTVAFPAGSVTGQCNEVPVTVTNPGGIQVSFQLRDANWTSSGAFIRGAGGQDVMTGTATAIVDFGGIIGIVTLSGNWDAARL